MKTVRTIFFLFAAIAMVSSGGCRKEKHEGRGLYGRVLQVNSNTPVDKALVVFYKHVPGAMIGLGTYQEVSRYTTGPDGVFPIPQNEEANFVRAYGLAEYEIDPSDLKSIAHDRKLGRVVYLYLRTPSWVLLKGTDTGQLGTVISGIDFHIQNAVTSIKDFTIDPCQYYYPYGTERVVKVLANHPLTVKYQITEPYANRPRRRPVVELNNLFAAGLDTLVVDVPY
jgi:hypothetical protein